MPSPSRSFFMTNAVANPVLIPLLRSRLGRRLGSRLAVVGAADRKTWWRNFEQPAPVTVRLAGVDHETTALAVSHGEDVVVEAHLEDRGHPDRTGG